MGGIQDGATPVFIAAQNGHKECIEVLARLGGDVNKAVAKCTWRGAVCCGCTSGCQQHRIVHVVLNSDMEGVTEHVRGLCAGWGHADLRCSAERRHRVRTGAAIGRCGQGRGDGTCASCRHVLGRGVVRNC